MPRRQTPPKPPAPVVALVPIPSEKNGRDTLGRFAAGCTGGPGRRPLIETNRAALEKALPPERIVTILEAMAMAAEDGHCGAAALCLAYGLGRPPEAPEESRAGETADERAAMFVRLIEAYQGFVPMAPPPVGYEFKS